MAAEYIVAAGNPNVILCERGIRTFETYTRNTMDLAAVPLLHHLTHLPVIVDPSHATGQALARQAARDRRRRRRRRRGHGRGPPLARGRPLGRRAAAQPGPVRGPHGRGGPRPRARPIPARGSARARRRARRRRDRPRKALIVESSGPASAGDSATPRRDRHAAVVRPADRLRGEIHVPGDKSISHRALMLGLLARGEFADHGCGRRGRRSIDGGHRSGPRRDDRAVCRRRRAGDVSRGLPRHRRPSLPGRDARLRQLGHEPSALRRDPRRRAA